MSVEQGGADSSGRLAAVQDLPGYDPRSWGIDPGYDDVNGGWHDSPPATVTAVLAAMGAEPFDGPGGMVRAGRVPPPVGQDVWVVRAGQPVEAGGRFTLTLEDGSERSGQGLLPPEVPLGYHTLMLHEQGRSVRLIVSPGRCVPAPEGSWGWAVQLYALRSAGSWGMGDLADLARLARWSAGLGAEALVVNPLHAPMPVGPQQNSPYSPASRVFRSPLYLRVERVDGARGLEGLAEGAVAGLALSDSPLIDRDAAWAAKSAVLEQIYRRWAASAAGFDSYRAVVGPALDEWGAFCAACEAYGPNWQIWPKRFSSPEGAVAATASDLVLADRARFHAWLQWQVDRQLADAGRQGVGLVQDLAIGCDPGGFDAWRWQETFAPGMSIGAPPDLLAPGGQDWGLPPFDPWRLRAQAFGPFIDVVRAGMRHAGGLRVDHVMGLFRLFWIPVGGGSAAGCYVRYPWKELLDVLALESVRAGAYCVGEDLGTVEPWVRQELAERQVLSTRLVWFEDQPPGPTWPAGSVGAVTTHDLPTVAGAWTGADVQDQRDAGMEGAASPIDELADRVSRWSGVPRDAPPDEAVLAAYRLLAAAPSAVVTATLDDALGVERRPNLPGTIDSQRANWRIPLPCRLEAIEQDPMVLELARMLAARTAP